MTSSVVDMVL